MMTNSPSGSAKNSAIARFKSDLIALLPRLRRFALSITQSVADADDLVQEACLRGISRMEQWDSAQPLDRWMFRLTRNLWISELRKRKVRMGQANIPVEQATELVDGETGEETLRGKQMTEAIVKLPDDLSSVLLLVSVEGYSYAETADLLGIPNGTVMSRMHRARKTLAQHLQAEPVS